MKLNKNINNIISDLINITDTVIIYTNINNNFILEKNNSNKKIETKKFIKNNKIIKNSLNKKIKNEYRKEINKFIKILSKKLKHCNFDTLNDNIKTLKINDKNFRLLSTRTLAAYNIVSNKLILNKKDYKNYISHELLHMSSCKKINNKYICSGFEQMKLTTLKKIGTFINEGYTEIINEKYFVNTNCYLIHKSFISLLELIIGDNLMEEMYFNSDIIGLINELLKYNNSLEDIIKFIINTDIIHESIYKISIIKKIKLKKALTEVNEFLINTYYEKLKQIIKDEKTIINYMKSFVDILKNIKIDINYNIKYIKNIEEYKIKKLSIY